MHTSEKTDPIIRDYAKYKKYYCSKCKYWRDNKCLKNRLLKKCLELRLKNV